LLPHDAALVAQPWVGASLEQARDQELRGRRIGGQRVQGPAPRRIALAHGIGSEELGRKRGIAPRHRSVTGR
jgi:hypothetical protein